MLIRERLLGEGKGYPLQYSGLENSMDSIFHGVTESDTTETVTSHTVNVEQQKCLWSFVFSSLLLKQSIGMLKHL